jgi:hypothetical protein
VRSDGTPVREELAGVLEDDHPVAEATPTLLGEGSGDMGGIPVDGIGVRATWVVLAGHHFSGAVMFGDISTALGRLRLGAGFGAAL